MQYCFLQPRTVYLHHQSHPQRVVFSLWLLRFILSGSISPRFSSSILGTYRPGECIFHCYSFLPIATVRGVLKARILKWLARGAVYKFEQKALRAKKKASGFGGEKRFGVLLFQGPP